MPSNKPTAGDPSPSKPVAVAPRVIRVGCAGWSIGTGQVDLFGAGESQLARYATRFDMVEINSSFHRPHRQQTYARWAEAVPRQFRFSVKVPRAITHDARLQGVGDALSRFADEVAGLGPKLGGVLVQLPPSLVHDARVANTFFSMLRRRIAAPVACEPRHASWFEPEVDALWHRHAVARVAADPPKPPPATAPGGAGHWSYWRWHGSPRIYYSPYGDTRLQALALTLRGHARAHRPAWCVFDNTAHGHAVTDALQLKALLGLDETAGNNLVGGAARVFAAR
jgi:uncharacterized protein YecE (DUF72 family)